MLEEQTESSLLNHLAIVMDGNGRWAEQRLLPRFVGHRKGVEVIREAIRFCADKKISHLSLFAFSTENWKRPAKEVQQLMSLFKKVLLDEQKGLLKNDVCLRVIGDRQGLPSDLVEVIQQVELNTAECNTLFLQIYANYGGRWEITQAVKSLFAEYDNPDSINEQILSQALVSADIPDPDLLIRTSGESRISNFMLWQLAYTELYFMHKYWPECSYQDFEQAVDCYTQRSRRFGNLTETDNKLSQSG